MTIECHVMQLFGCMFSWRDDIDRPMETDRIEKSVLLHAPQSRIWRALTDAKEFGSWFGMKLDGSFVPGAKLRGLIVPTTVDPAVAKMQKQYEGSPLELVVERMEPEHSFSFRWHPHGVQAGIDYVKEPKTLVTFTL
jgi:uncharacterized protein YndB with AHSA1/START domain